MRSAAHLFGKNHRESVVGSLTSKRWIVLKPEDPQLGHLCEDFMQGNPRVVFPLIYPGIDFLLNEGANYLPKLLVLISE
jgi:hypothetical protein